MIAFDNKMHEVWRQSMLAEDGMRLFWLEQEEADILVQKIQNGEITDLTEYHAEWK